MSERGPETNVSIQIDPSLHLIMRAARAVLDLPTINAVYAQATEEFIANHPEIAEQFMANLHTADPTVAGAMERLHLLDTKEKKHN